MEYNGTFALEETGEAAAERTTSRNYMSPYRPMGIRIANLLLPVLNRIGIPGGLAGDLDQKELLSAAEKRNGLTDFGGSGFLLPMNVLLQSINEESRLHPVGKFITRERLVNILGNRLRKEYWFSRYPEIAEEKISAPLVITGLQRTGTTFLHRLLSVNTSTAAVRSWEAINPAPHIDNETGEPVEGENDPRRKFARISQRALSYMAPDFFAVHPVESEEPEEDVLLLDFAFLSTVPEATLRVPSYSRWLERQNHVPAYHYLKRLLQLLLWQRRRLSGDPGDGDKRQPRLILKTPHHMEYLDALFEVFPDAKVVQTHRDPGITLSSFSSMIAHGRGVFSDEIDPLEIGRDWRRKISRMVNNVLEVRRKTDNGEENRFFDVSFKRLIREPVEVLKEVHSFAGIPLTEESLTAIQYTAENHIPGKYGVHRYSPEDFGFTREDIRDEFKEYIERFDLSEGNEKNLV